MTISTTHGKAALSEQDSLETLLSEPEGARLEFKEAKNNFHIERLAKYCAALANEGGGSIILGVTDRRPRRIVGTSVFEEPGRIAANLCERLRIRIDFKELIRDGNRILVFHAPPRPIGLPIQCDGIYWSRAGDELRSMPTEELRRIFDEAGPDFSAEINSGATTADLEPATIERFRAMWIRRSGNTALGSLSVERLLDDAELVRDAKVTNAALILLGSERGLSRCLAQAEVVFEYRPTLSSIPFQRRVEYRRGFLGVLDD